MTEQTNSHPRIFKIGATHIVEDASLAGRDLDAVKDILKHSYPEVANATVRETDLDDGTRLVEFLPVAGRKG